MTTYDEMRLSLAKDLRALRERLEELYSAEFLRLTDIEEDEKHDSYEDLQEVLAQARRLPGSEPVPDWLGSLARYIGNSEKQRSCFEIIQGSLKFLTV